MGTQKKPHSIRGFLLDEHIQAACVDTLLRGGCKAAQPGHDPLRLGVPPKGTSDPALLKWATKHHFCFVTKDQGLAGAGAVPARHSGVIILICTDDDELTTIDNLAKTAQRPELGSALVNWRFALTADGQVLPIAPDGTIGWQ